MTERIALLRRVHPDTDFQLRLDPRRPLANAGVDLVKGILTNLAAERRRGRRREGHGAHRDRVRPIRTCSIEVHDSGPGLSDAASATLFEPTITFKKHGMGLGLSIAKKNALLSNGDSHASTVSWAARRFASLCAAPMPAVVAEWAS